VLQLRCKCATFKLTGAEFERFVACHAEMYLHKFACSIYAVLGKDVLCQIEAYGCDGHGLFFPKNERVDEG